MRIHLAPLMVLAAVLCSPLAMDVTADGLSVAEVGAAEVAGHAAGVVPDWPMLPGETLQHLAKLIYPDDVHMQRHLVAAMLALNPETWQAIAPGTPFTQTTYILLPDLRQLSFLAKAHTRPSTANDH